MAGPKKKRSASVPSSSGRLRSVGLDAADRLSRSIKNPSLKDTHPHVAEEWGRNGPLTARHVTYGSGLVVDWICKRCKQSWQSRIQTRTKGSSCPYCRGRRVGETNSISAMDDKAGREFEIKSNDGRRPEDIAGTLKEEKFNFRCLSDPKHGLYRRTPYARVILKKGCPKCFKAQTLKANRDKTLAVLEPYVAMQWHKEKNDFTPFDVTTGSHRKAWLVCEYGHESYSRICDKVRRPFCSQCMNEVGRKMTRERQKPAWKTVKHRRKSVPLKRSKHAR